MKKKLKEVKVKSVKRLGKKNMTVYDITMKSNPHTFFANDILVHNSCYFKALTANNIKEAEKIGYDVLNEVDNKAIPGLVSEIFNGDDIMRSDFEAIAGATLSYGKKKQYAFLKVWKDGNELPKTKLDITGLSIKRSDSPKKLSDEMKPFFIQIMKGIDKKEIKNYIDKIEKSYYNLNVYGLAAKRTANGLKKYYNAFLYEIINKDRPYNIEKIDEYIEKNFNKKLNISDEIYKNFMRNGKGKYSIDGKNLIEDKNGDIEIVAKVKMVLPFHIKASIFYNYLIDEYGIESEFPKIIEGDKIKVLYINPIKKNIKYKDYDYIMEFDCIAFSSNTTKIPPFIEEFKIDKKRMLNTYFINKMETIFDVIEYNPYEFKNEAVNMLF